MKFEDSKILVDGSLMKSAETNLNLMAHTYDFEQVTLSREACMMVLYQSSVWIELKQFAMFLLYAYKENKQGPMVAMLNKRFE